MQDPFDLGQLRIGFLKHGGPLDQHVDPDPIANRHLVGQPTEIELQLGHPRLELVTATP